MTSGAALRDEGIEVVMENAAEWADEVEVAFNWWLEHIAPAEFTLEQFRMFVEAHDMPPPHHPNAWGGLAKKFANRITPIGYSNSARPSAHARLTRTYRRA